MNPTVDDKRRFVLDARHRYDQSVLCYLKAARRSAPIKVQLARAVARFAPTRSGERRRSSWRSFKRSSKPATPGVPAPLRF